jgi:hypothetical protein
VAHAVAIVVVTGCLFALAVWIGWWLFLATADEYDWRGGPPFSMKEGRDVAVMVLAVATIVGGGVLYVAYKAAVVMCS